MVINITIKIPVNKPAWLIAHGTANNEVPIMVFQMDNLKKNDFHHFCYQYIAVKKNREIIFHKKNLQKKVQFDETMLCLPQKG